MKLILILFVLAFTLSLKAEDLFLKIGHSITLDVLANQKVHLANSKPVKVIDKDDRLLIIGRALGKSELFIGNRRLTIQVLPKNSFDSLNGLKSLTNQFLGLNAVVSEDQVIIEGRLHRFSDWLQIKDVAQKNNYTFSFQAELDEDLHSKAKEYLENEVLKFGLPLPKISFSPSLNIEMQHSTDKEKDLLKKILSPLGLTANFIKSKVSLKPLVEVQIIIAEVAKQTSKSLGVDWDSENQFSVLPNFEMKKPLLGQLQFLSQNGNGQVLAAPKLLTKSETKAEFLAGGEFPIELISEDSSKVIWKKHGVLLEVKPTAKWNGEISVDLTAEVSIINGSQSKSGTPGLHTNRLKTHINMMSGRTIALSGLIKANFLKSKSGVAGLQSIPLLGGLFSSKKYLSQRSELIIFVIPKIISPLSQQPIEYPNGWKHNYGN